MGNGCSALQVCKSLVALEQHTDAAAIVKDLLTCRFMEKDQRDQLHFLYVGVAFDHGDFEAAYEGIRLICLRNPQSTRAWNLLNTTTIRYRAPARRFGAAICTATQIDTPYGTSGWVATTRGLTTSSSSGNCCEAPTRFR